MGNWFPAKYPGNCVTCGDRFEEADMIRAAEGGGWEADCCLELSEDFLADLEKELKRMEDRDPALAELGRRVNESAAKIGLVCGKCFTVLPVSGVCGVCD